MNFKNLYLKNLTLVPQIKDDILKNLQNIEGVKYVNLNLYENFKSHQIIGSDDSKEIKILIFYDSEIKSNDILSKILKLNNYYKPDHFEFNEYTIYDKSIGYIVLTKNDANLHLYIQNNELIVRKSFYILGKTIVHLKLDSTNLINVFSELNNIFRLLGSGIITSGNTEKVWLDEFMYNVPYPENMKKIGWVIVNQCSCSNTYHKCSVKVKSRYNPNLQKLGDILMLADYKKFPNLDDNYGLLKLWEKLENDINIKYSGLKALNSNEIEISIESNI